MGSERYDAVIDSPIGKLGIRLHGDSVRQVEFLGDDIALRSATTPAARGVVAAICEYFKTGRYGSALDMELEGTEFQRRVWKALHAIPAGTGDNLW